MDEPCSIQASYPSYIKKNETTEIVSQKSNFLGSPHFPEKKARFIKFKSADNAFEILAACFDACERRKRSVVLFFGLTGAAVKFNNNVRSIVKLSYSFNDFGDIHDTGANGADIGRICTAENLFAVVLSGQIGNTLNQVDRISRFTHIFLMDQFCTGTELFNQFNSLLSAAGCPEPVRDRSVQPAIHKRFCLQPDKIPDSGCDNRKPCRVLLPEQPFHCRLRQLF